MKTSHLFLLATPILAAVAPATTAEQCGSLGVMTYTAASLDTSAAGGNGVDPAQIRTCQDHPLGPAPRPEHAVGPRPAPADNKVGGGANSTTVNRWGWGWGWWHGGGGGWGNCWDVDPGDYGCSGGYCYKACDGDGRWCWTARNRGYGDWQTCDRDSDCANLDNVGCGKGFYCGL
ncbi:hypothetical protein CPAR01_02360 [Colletotrichum paranaense]|uniref:IDI-2 n=1 Tax=Colletotrichum paranaense TaxID=1914294 RepID=A0ABQ9SZA1_9PEZI|nr:uncharacterized protein CPAR01_02360 [Colletotrichum paranaense]KAK1544858.1 hypothetical protein CPAR01_02360 [Colletotrichum paranaense]